MQAPGGSEEGTRGRRGRARGGSRGGGTAETRLHMVSERVRFPWFSKGRWAPLLCDGSLCGVCAGRDAAKWWTAHTGADSQVWHCI